MPADDIATGYFAEPAVMTDPGRYRPLPEETIGEEHLALFDRLAGLTCDPGAGFAALTAAYAGDGRLRVPATVYNAILNRPEPVPDGTSS